MHLSILRDAPPPKGSPMVTSAETGQATRGGEQAMRAGNDSYPSFS